MKVKSGFPLLFLFATISYVNASIIKINPTSDGSIYTCSGCVPVSDGGYVLASGYIQGVIKFSSESISNSISTVRLSINPYGLPLWDSSVDIYGFGSSIGTLSSTDGNAGIFLGTLNLPTSLGYGQDAFFDVTTFALSTKANFLGFNLRTTGTDVFSSLEYNYGHPAQLELNSVPEPSTISLFIMGMILFALSILIKKHQLKIRKI